MLIRVLDFETTGMPEDAGGAAVCEVGWCDLDVVEGDPVPGAVQCHVGKPTAFFVNPGRPMPPTARAVHHIGDDDVLDGPSPDVGFRRLMDGPPAYFCAHNAKFEQAFFAGGQVPWICSYKVALRLWPDAPGHSNQVLRYVLDCEIADAAAAMPPHRAGPDAYVTAHILARAVEDGRASIDDMVRWSSGPALLPRITFGKHRGERWEDVPAGYLEWIADKSELDADTKANARHHLRSRQRGASS